MTKNIIRSDVKNALEVLEYFIRAKQDQLKDEPNEIMWKSQNWQLMGARELLEMDIELFDEEYA